MRTIVASPSRMALIKRYSKTFLRSLFTSKHPVLISHRAFQNLASLPRYQSGVTTTLEGNKLHYSDACTLLGGITEIYEQRVYDFIPTGSSPVIIDCGANIGLASLWFAQHIPGCRVFSYEADPDLYQLLRLNISSFGFESAITPIHAALASHSNGVTFSQEGGFSGQIKTIDHSIFKSDIFVDSVTLPQVVSRHARIDLLKIDVEGAENDFLIDNIDLSTVQNLFLEYHSFQDKPQLLPRILDVLALNGFRYHIREAYPSPHPFISINTLVGMDLQLNIYAFRPQ